MPKTAAGFEKDFNQLKKDTKQVYRYVSMVPPATVKSLFKTSEVASEVFSGLLKAIHSEGLADKEACEKSGDFLAALGSAANFDMTLMFLDEAEIK